MSAFRELVERYQKRIYYLAKNLTGNHQDAEDLAQDVFLKVYHSISKFRQEARLETWLHKVTVNAFIDKKRKKILKLMDTNSPSEPQNPSQEPIEKSISGNPERYTDARLMQQHIQQALKQLSPKERSVFVLKHYQQQSIREISGMLNIAEGTVKSLLFRAIRKLQKSLSFYKPDLGLENNK